MKVFKEMEFLTTSIWKTLHKFRVEDIICLMFLYLCAITWNSTSVSFQILHVHLHVHDHVLKGTGQFQAVKIESWLVCMIESYLEVVFVLLLMDMDVVPYEHHISSCKCIRNTARCIGSVNWVLSKTR